MHHKDFNNFRAEVKREGGGGGGVEGNGGVGTGSVARFLKLT